MGLQFFLHAHRLLLCLLSLALMGLSSEHLVNLLLLELFEKFLVKVVVRLSNRKLMQFLLEEVLVVQTCATFFPELLEKFVIVEEFRVLNHPDHVFVTEGRLYTPTIGFLDEAVVDLFSLTLAAEDAVQFFGTILQESLLDVRVFARDLVSEGANDVLEIELDLPTLFSFDLRQEHHHHFKLGEARLFLECAVL